jgi:acetyltransferase-like isoleucine patch superfamily enzyme
MNFYNKFLGNLIKVINHFIPNRNIKILEGGGRIFIHRINTKSIGNIYALPNSKLGGGNDGTSEFFQNNAKSFLNNCGSIKLGVNTRLTNTFRLENFGNIIIGDHTYINPNSVIKIKNSLSIGNACAISWDVMFMDNDYHTINGKEDALPIYIGNHVLIGARSIILKGAQIGDNSIVAAGSVVTGHFPANSLIGGVPAKILKTNVDWI